MYEDYFGFKICPFSITPDPRFYFDTASCREAFAGLRYGIEGRKGLIVITGEPGTGKTRLVKDFMQRAEVMIRTAFIANPKLGATELLPFVLNGLRITPATQDPGALTVQLKEYLFDQFKKRHIVALLIDEAQQLSNELLEELRLLSNLETDEEKLLQIVLLGQPELEDRLEQPELRQLKQRVMIRCRLAPLKD
ncbi:MAG: ExeA family protein, partial [Candidatus Binatia bacterium]